MRLDELIGDSPAATPIAKAQAAGEMSLTGLSYDSRTVKPGELFFCVGGFHRDGHEFAAQAVQNGAVALVVERQLDLPVAEVLVDSARAAMAPLAARFYGHPSRELRVVGVTGTNGKTTTTYMARALLEAGGQQCGLLGTVKSVIGGHERPVKRTTPEAIDLQADLRAMLDGGDRACAIEVSSHALELGRTQEVAFAAAVFTNLTQDHLDFHETMEDYYGAKRLLFLPASGGPPAASVVNIGDPYGRRLAAEVKGARTFALEAQADYSAHDVRCDFAGCTFTLQTPEGSRRVSLPLPGRFNVANALGALAAVHALGHPLELLVPALEMGVRVPGRFEPVAEGQDFAVLVDYAHTPDSLENVLGAARELAAASAAGACVLCVFGAGGDRDRGKRPLMGQIAARLADTVIVTSDNPRSEDPEEIIDEIMRGMSPGDLAHGTNSPKVQRIADRREAIRRAVACATTGDVLVIAGKGHEQGQELPGGRVVPFDDASVAREALRSHSQSRPEAIA
jgi:UDP-N-acetylmuramoyl-L-alanyl-D-glutamate--2,6-diaminopimelate ligase